jgi:tetratricopeptide (TPR) repeat protein
VAETVTVAESLCDLFPESADALEMKARTLIWLGKYSDAVQTWEACLQLDPEYVHAYVGMASAAAARAEHDSAAQLAARVIELDPENFQARATRADALLQLGRADEVPAILEEYLAKDPRSLGFYYLGQAYTQLQQYDQAAKHFEAAVRIFPDYTEAYNGLAVAYERLGDVEQAAQAMEKFRELGSPERMAARIRGATESELVQMQRDAAVLYTDAGRVLYVGDRPDEAERLWLRAAWLDPQNVPCRQSLAFLCRNAGRLGETIAWLKQLAELDPQPEIPSYWIEIGRTYQELAFLPAAEEAFRAAIAAAPASDAGYAGLADLLLRFERNLVETRELAQQAVDRRPSAANYAILAAACRANGDLASARTAIERAIELAPQHLAYRAVQDVIAAELQP